MKKKLISITVSLLLMLGITLALASCGEAKPVYLIQNGTTEYSLTYSSDLHEDYAYLLLATISDELNCDIDFYEYGEKTTAKEIILGDTDRPISIELKAAAEALKTTDEDFVWGYGYKDGNLAFYANSKIAFDIAWEQFIATTIKDGAMQATEDLWVTGIKTYEKYQEELKEEMEAQDKIVEDALLSKLSKFSPAYTSKWGTSIKTFPTSYNTTIKPISSHPRLLVNSETLPTVIANLSNPENQSTYNSVMNTAEQALLKNGGVTGAAGNFSGEAIEDIEALAFMYLTTGREKYGYAAILHSLNLIDTLKFTDASYLNSNYAGSTIYILAETYDWCYDLFTPEQRTAFINGACNNIAKYFEIGYPPNADAAGVSGHDAETGILRNWLAFGIAVYNEKPQIYNFVAGKIIADYVPAANFYLASGVHHQGSAYGASPRLYSSMISAILMKTATGKDIYECDLGAVIMTHLNRLRPDGEALRIGDDFNRGGATYNVNNGLMQLAFYAGSVYGNPIAKDWFEDSNVPMSYERGHLELTPVIYLIFNDPTVEASDKYDLELVHYNPAPSGSVIARSAWGDAGAWLTYTNIKCAYEGNHDHKDAGTFQIYYKGILAPDTGAYEYSGTQGYNSLYDKAYVKQTISKNGLLIYNPNITSNRVYSGGQSLSDINNNGDFGNHTLQEWENKYSINQSAVLGYSSKIDNGELVYTYISGDITGAYDSATVNLVTRSTMTLATGDANSPMVFIVYDRIISDNPSFEKSFVLHTTNKPVFGNGADEVEITQSITGQKNWMGFNKVTNTNTFYYDNTLGADGAYAQDKPNDKYNGQLTLKTLIPENPTYYYVGGNGKRFWLNGNSYGDEYVDQKLIAEIGWGRVEITPTEQNADDTFLNVMYVSDAGVTVTEEANLVEGNTHDGVVTYGNCVMFQRADKTANTYNHDATEAQKQAAIQNTLVKDTVTFSTAGKADGETLNYYVGGLAEGTWTVSVGSFTSTVEVTAEGAIAVFEAPIGEVTLTRM